MEEASWLRQTTTRLFGLDSRSLAAARIAVGLLLLVDLGVRAIDLEMFYTDSGLNRVAAARKYLGTFQWTPPWSNEEIEGNWRWSLHCQSGSAHWQIFLFVTAALFAAALLVGYQTRLVTIASWALLLSLHYRAPPIINGGDIMLRVLLFWAMFLPWGRVWSLDALRRPASKDRFEPVVGIAAGAALLQLCLVYWFSAEFKRNDYWLEGQALQMSLSFLAYQKPLAVWLLNYPELLRASTYAAWGLELVGPMLLFIPWKTGFFRTLVFFAFVGLHAGIELTLHVGLFSYISCAYWLIVLPGGFWTSSPVAAVGRFLGWLFAWQERPLAEAKPAPRTLWKTAGTVLASLFCAAMFAYVLWWNFATLQTPKHFRSIMPNNFIWIGKLTGMGQKWDMFSVPAKLSGWHVVRAELADGRTVDLLSGGEPVSLERPANIAGRFPNHRWRKFFRRLVEGGNMPKQLGKNSSVQQYREAAAEYLARKWNAEHARESRVLSVELHYYGVRYDRHQPGEYTSVKFAEVNLEEDASESLLKRALRRGKTQP